MPLQPPNDSGATMRASSAGFRSTLDVVATFAMMAASGCLIWGVFWQPPRNQRQGATLPSRAVLPSEPVPLQGAAWLGQPTARFAVLEYSDFLCPYCAKAALEVLPTFIEKHVKTGAVMLAFRHFPLERLHPFAITAAAAGECAATQGKFWLMHDALFQHQRSLNRKTIDQHASLIGLDPSEFASCLAREQTLSRVREDAKTAQLLGIRATPTFLIGVVESGFRLKVLERLSGLPTVSVLDEAIARITRLEPGIPE